MLLHLSFLATLADTDDEFESVEGFEPVERTQWQTDAEKSYDKLSGQELEKGKQTKSTIKQDQTLGDTIHQSLRYISKVKIIFFNVFHSSFFFGRKANETINPIATAIYQLGLFCICRKYKSIKTEKG